MQKNTTICICDKCGVSITQDNFGMAIDEKDYCLECANEMYIPVEMLVDEE